MSENYPTHATRLWLDNTEANLDDVNDYISLAEPTAYVLAAWLKEYVDNMTEDVIPDNGLINDLFRSAFEQIDWDSLAESYLSNWEAENK